jgi:lipopolysaccharide export system protein LptC
LSIRRQWVSPVLLGILAALSWWLYRNAAEPRPPVRGASDNSPDAFVEDMVLSTLDSNGRLAHRLTAERAEHFPGDRAELLAPALEVHRPQGMPWSVRSKYATVSAAGRQIELRGGVEIHRQPEPGDGAVHAYTSHLLLRPDDKYAETDAAVRYLSAGTQLTAVGMRAFFDEGRVELLSRVTGRYE